MEFITECLFSLILIGSCSLGFYWYSIAWLRPRRICRELGRQGIGGPAPSLLSGNLAEMKRIVRSKKDQGEGSSLVQNYYETLFPHFNRWRKDYGPTYLYWTGRRPMLYVTDPNIVRDISLCVSLDLGKPNQLTKSQEPLFGHGIIRSNGQSWAHQRKIIAPEFFMDKVKGMLGLMVESAIPLLNSWDTRINSQGGTGEIIIDDDLRSFSADAISRTSFGSDYSRGKEIFRKLRDLIIKHMSSLFFFEIPYLRFLPTKSNLEKRKLEREIRSLILKVVKERRDRSDTLLEKDLLQSILESYDVGRVSSDASDSFVVDNCKNIYLAGNETSAAAATWCLMLLASHPEWQARARAEVMELCGEQPPDIETIQKMKTLTMVVQETLRLFPPSTFVVRETFREMKFGDIQVPKGIDLWIPIPAMHRDPTIWGPDANEFKPERFAHGLKRACEHPHVYMPFGLGARTCLGQHFAMAELKIVLSLILSRFTFSLSPSYRHSPAFRLLVEPEFGVPLVVKKV